MINLPLLLLLLWRWKRWPAKRHTDRLLWSWIMEISYPRKPRVDYYYDYDAGV